MSHTSTIHVRNAIMTRQYAHTPTHTQENTYPGSKSKDTHIYTHTKTHTHAHTLKNTYLGSGSKDTHMYTNTRTHTHAHTLKNTYPGSGSEATDLRVVCVYVCVRVCVCVCACLRDNVRCLVHIGALLQKELYTIHRATKWPQKLYIIGPRISECHKRAENPLNTIGPHTL